MGVVLTPTETKDLLWKELKRAGVTDAGAAGVMANIQAESGFCSDNVQNAYESRVGDDETYAYDVNSGKRSETAFTKDGAGYGLAQWTYWTRKKALYDHTINMGYGIQDTAAQVQFLIYELKHYSSVWQTICTTTSIKDATLAVLLKYERPASMNTEATQNKRIAMAEAIYDEYHSEQHTVKSEARDIIEQMMGLLSKLRNIM